MGSPATGMYLDEAEQEALLEETELVAMRSGSLPHRFAVGAVTAVMLVAVGAAVATRATTGAASGNTQVFDGIVELAGDTSKKSLPDKQDHEEKEKHPRCSWPLENCTDSQCCMKGGQQCYVQNNKTNYATCMNDCKPGPHPAHWDGEWWTCATLGKRTEGESHCSQVGENCVDTLCCEQAGTQCFKKADGWAMCKTDCEAGAPDMTDQDGHFWSCEKLGPWTQGAAPWVEGQCSQEGEDCRMTKCCAQHGQQCYEQNGDWASCRYDCQPGPIPEREWEPEWTCNEIGERTPGDPPAPTGIVGKWVSEACAWSNDDCSQSRCCIGMNQQCYEKNKDWAVCKEDCTAGPDVYDNNETWSCKPLGSRSTGLSLKGSPSLYCWSLFQVDSYEADIMRNQLGQDSGIFQCDDWALLSTADPTVIGTTRDGRDAKTLHVDMAEITTSVDGTAGNAQLFINCWNVVVQEGRWNNHAWTIKVDPDAVVLADRLRNHLRPYVLENVYVVNCNKFPSSPNFPMMYGSLEIYSWKAIQTYANGMSTCMDEMAMMLPLWGEDYFMTHCLDRIGVGRISDFASVGDAVCLGANCGDGYVAAFHPFKTVESWQECWDIAHR